MSATPGDSVAIEPSDNCTKPPSQDESSELQTQVTAILQP